MRTADDNSWRYAIPAIPLAALALSFYVFLPKLYTDHFGVTLGTMALIVLGTRFWDAVLDPLIGSLSDRTVSPRGRRRSWILYASIPLAVVVPLLFAPGVRPDGVSSAVWLSFFAFAFFLFWTAMSVPYEALGAELSTDYHFRTSLLAKRDGMYLLGTLLAGLLPVVFRPIFFTEESAWGALGIFYALLLLWAVFANVPRIAELACPPKEAADPSPAFFKSLMTVRNNRPFLVLLTAYGVSALGAALPASLLLYYVEDVLKSSRGNLFLLLYLLSGCFFLPVWVSVSRRFEKRNTWIVSMLLNSGAFSLVFFLGPGDELAFGILVVCSGLGLGATLALPSSMQADVIDYDEWLSGERREGLYVGLWAIVKKAAAAIGTAIGFFLLDRLGYRAAAGAPSESALWMLRFLYAAVPSLCNFLAIAVALSYSLSLVEHRRVQQAIKEKKDGVSGHSFE